VVPHLPFAQTFVQQSVECTQVVPAPKQVAPETPQVFEVASHAPEQQLAAVAQASPGPAQLVFPPLVPALAPAPAPPVCVCPPPPSPLRALTAVFPHPASAARIAIERADPRAARTFGVMQVGAMSYGGRLTSATC
jgi:hypothetical protein